MLYEMRCAGGWLGVVESACKTWVSRKTEGLAMRGVLFEAKVRDDEYHPLRCSAPSRQSHWS
jgi:hypothetical protein